MAGWWCIVLSFFHSVNVETEFGVEEKVKMKLPIFTGALGSTDIARINWEHMAIGAAISGITVVVGENICGMDGDAEMKNGRVVKSPEMERRVRTFQKWQNGYGEILVQLNVEDTRLGVAELAIELGVKAIELKWGQGAKDIGGEVKLPSLDRALQLNERGYIVLPQPQDQVVQEAFGQGDFKEFERHSRLGMVDEDGFYKSVERLRKPGIFNESILKCTTTPLFFFFDNLVKMVYNHWKYRRRNAYVRYNHRFRFS